MRRNTKAGLSLDTYLGLVRQFPLVSIQSDRQLSKASQFLDSVMAKGDLDDGEQTYVDALSDLIELYEDEHVTIDPPSQKNALEFLMDQHEMTQAELCRKMGIPKSVVSEVLNGKRGLSKSNIQKLARYFHVDASVFL